MQLESFNLTYFRVKNSVLPLFIYKLDILVSRQEVKLFASRSYKTEFTNFKHRMPGIASSYM